MKTIQLQLLLLALIFVIQIIAISQTPGPYKLSVPLTDPSRPASLKIGLINGSITITGYAGKEVIAEAKVRDFEDAKTEDRRTEKTRGLRLIPNTSTGLTVEEDDNVVNVKTGLISTQRPVDVTIQVPFITSIKASAINDGDIEISDVTGDMEVSNINGPVTLSNISGSAVVDAINQAIKVTFKSVDPKKSMSFSSLNGDIDVTFPPDLKANVKMKNEQGQIYSDFDIKMDNSPVKVEDNVEKRRGKYKVKMEGMMSGTINGGGPDFQFKNFNGDILIRKGK